jgi:hypothetical protein
MGYTEIAVLHSDPEFLQRVAACYSTQTGTDDPDTWATRHAWDMAAQPGFGDAYASAVAGGIEHPGANPSVISDAQILSAVQSIATP